MDIVIGRAAINQTTCLLSETELALSLSRSFPLFLFSSRFRRSLVTYAQGAGIYTLRYTLSTVFHYRRFKRPAFLYTRYIRRAFTIFAAGPGQVLFFIDSFERMFGAAPAP